MKAKHLFFDLDHTLWDFESNSEKCLEEILIQYKFLAIDLSFEDFAKAFGIINAQHWDQLEKNEITIEYLRKARFKDTFEAVGITITDEQSLEINGLFLELLPTKSLLIDHAKAILEHFKGSHSLHILSNGWHDIQIRKMKNGGILEYFDKIITFDNSQSRKPNKEIFEYALKAAEALPHECIMIGDNYAADVLGAENVGIRAIHLDPKRIGLHHTSVDSLIGLKSIIIVD